MDLYFIIKKLLLTLIFEYSFLKYIWNYKYIYVFYFIAIKIIIRILLI